MKVLAIGINESKIKGNEKYENWRSKSPSDVLINNVLSSLFGKYKQNYFFLDIINKKMSNDEFKKLNDNEKLRLCEENKESFLNKIKKIKPDIILLLFMPNSYKQITNYINSLKQKEENFPKTIHIYHPAWISRYHKKTKKGYKEYIKERIKNDTQKLCHITEA